MSQNTNVNWKECVQSFCVSQKQEQCTFVGCLSVKELSLECTVYTQWRHNNNANEIAWQNTEHNNNTRKSRKTAVLLRHLNRAKSKTACSFIFGSSKHGMVNATCIQVQCNRSTKAICDYAWSQEIALRFSKCLYER